MLIIYCGSPVEYKKALLKMLQEYPILWDIRDNNSYTFKDKCIRNTARGNEFYGNAKNIRTKKHYLPLLDQVWEVDPNNPKYDDQPIPATWSEIEAKINGSKK